MKDFLRAPSTFSLSDIDPRSTPGFSGGKAEGTAALAAGADEFSNLQERLYAESRFGSERSVLLVLQAMDTAGKGGILRHVIGQVNPQGVQSAAFTKPTPEELEHDFLWRIRKKLPDAGQLGVFDRSHYEDVLIHKVRGFSSPEVIEERYGLIRDFESALVGKGTTIIKVMLHISAKEQGDRLASRLERPDKHWKYNPGDVDERELWPDYMAAYQRAVSETSTDTAPWFVVPADRKWYARLAVQRLLVETLRGFRLQWPPADYDVVEEKRRLAATLE